MLWLFHLGISCTVSVLCCFVMCVRARARVCVCVCVGVLVICTLTEIFLNLTEVLPCFFLSCKANAWVKLAKTGHGPHSSALVCICVVRLLLFVLFGCYYLFFGCYLCCSMYCLCVNVYWHRVTTQLQLINISYIGLFLSWEYPFWFTPTFSQTQLEHKTRILKMVSYVLLFETN